MSGAESGATSAGDRVAVIIVNYGTPDDVAVLVRDLARQERVAIDCVCVDITGDVDGPRCAELLAGPGFRWEVLRSENVGYGSANNAGLRLARELWGAHWAIVTNPDIEIGDAEAVWRLQQALIAQREAGAWLAGPRIVASDGRTLNPYLVSDLSPERIRVEKIKHELPVVSQVIEAAQLIVHLTKSLWTPVRRTVKADTCDHSRTQQVFAVHGCFFMIDVDSMIAGGVFPPFDERIFMYCEELALGKRIQLAGGFQGYVPSVEVVHAEDASNRHRPRTLTLLRTLRQFNRSRRYVMREYYRTSRGKGS